MQVMSDFGGLGTFSSGARRNVRLCGVGDRIEAKSDATIETVLTLGRERMKLSSVCVPQ